MSKPIAYIPTATGSTTARDIRDRLADVVNVKDFGAKGNGTADDSAALNAALQAAVGKILYLDGTFKCVSQYLRIPSNTHLVGAPGTKIIRTYNTAEGVAALARIVPATGESTVYDVTIDGIIFDGNGANYSTNSFDILFVSQYPAKNISILNCVFKDVVDYHAIDVNRCNSIQIIGCRFEGWKQVNVSSDDWTADKREAIQLDGYDVSDTANRNQNVLVRDCYFGASSTTGFGAWPAAVGNHGWFDSADTCHHITIEGNTFDQLTYYAITCMAWKFVNINHNHFIKCHGISVICRNSNDTPSINATAQNIVITGNDFNGGSVNEKTALYIWWSAGKTPSESNVNKGLARYIVFSNNVVDHYARLVTAVGCIGLIIANNYCTSVTDGTDCCVILMSKDVSIISNTFYMCKRLYISGQASGYTFNEEMAKGHNISGNFFGNHGATRVIHIGANAGDNLIANNIIQSNVSTGSDSYIDVASTSFPAKIINNTIMVKASSISIPIPTYKENFNNSYFINGTEIYPYAGRNIATLPDSSLALVGREDPDNYYRATYNAYSNGNTYEIAGFVNNSSTPNPLVFIGRGTSNSENLTEIQLRLTSAQYLKLTTSALLPYATNTIALGGANNKYTTVYATTGTINTSDERQKSNIADIDERVMKAWGKVNFKVFQHNDSIAEKGVAKARLHVGLVAQQVAEAFASEGLDASRYGLFCYDKWDATYEDVVVEDVPAVTEDVEVIDSPAIYDDDGELLVAEQKRIETKVIEPAQTHTEKRLVSEAGDGYGIRYEEALAMECAYQRWRLDRLESK